MVHLALTDTVPLLIQVSGTVRSAKAECKGVNPSEVNTSTTNSWRDLDAHNMAQEVPYPVSVAARLSNLVLILRLWKMWRKIGRHPFGVSCLKTLGLRGRLQTPT